MTRETHTPGPWECDTVDQPIVINGPADAEGHDVICTIMDSECKNQTYAYPPEVAAANARLIAQAPALLDLLETLCDEIELSMPEKCYEFNASNIWYAYKRARALIAIAYGKRAELAA